MNRFDQVRVALLNGLSWFGTLVTMQHLQAAVTLIAGIGSIAVSVATVFWIRKQARALDAKEKE